MIKKIRIICINAIGIHDNYNKEVGIFSQHSQAEKVDSFFRKYVTDEYITHVTELSNDQELDSHYEEIYDLLKAKSFRLAAIINGTNDLVLINENMELDTIFVTTQTPWFPDVTTGNILIVGDNRKGLATNCETTVDDIIQLIHEQKLVFKKINRTTIH